MWPQRTGTLILVCALLLLFISSNVASAELDDDGLGQNHPQEPVVPREDPGGADMAAVLSDEVKQSHNHPQPNDNTKSGVSDETKVKVRLLCF